VKPSLPNHPCRAIGTPTTEDESHLPTGVNAKVSLWGRRACGANLMVPPSDWGSRLSRDSYEWQRGPTVQGSPLILESNGCDICEAGTLRAPPKRQRLKLKPASGPTVLTPVSEASALVISTDATSSQPRP
jgi:hypothetical protein